MLNRKNKAIYRFLIRIIRELVLHFDLQHEFSWELATIDFEGGTIKAFEDCIPFMQLHGCHFHFCQAVFRKLTALGLKGHYMDNEFHDFAFFVRCIFALAFLPVNRVQDTFETLVNRLEEDYEERGVDYPEAVVDFVSYLHKNWVKQGSKYP